VVFKACNGTETVSSATSPVMSQLQTTIEWPFRVNGETDSCEREITVEYNYSRGCRGARGSCGEPIEPDEPPSIEITKVLLPSPGPIDRDATEDILDELSKEQRERLEILCLEDVAESYEREQEERQDYRK